MRNLVRVSVETASYTTLLSLVGGVVSVASSQTDTQTANVPLAFTLPLPSLYALSMIVTLSSRQRRTPATVTGMVHLPDLFAPGGLGFCLEADSEAPSPVLDDGTNEQRARFADDVGEKGESGNGKEELEEDDSPVAFVDLRTTRVPGRGMRSSAVASILTAESAAEGETTAGHLQWA